MQSQSISESDSRHPKDVNSRLRLLAHDLSNSLETILQATYLLKQCKAGSGNEKWVQLIDTASQEAAQTNREIRELLRTQGG